MTFVKNTKNFNPADTSWPMWDKYPTHQTECAKTWEEMIKDLPTIEDNDIIDIYIFKNGLLVWPKK